jgi:GNAT superfamily N-acetyltransferase
VTATARPTTGWEPNLPLQDSLLRRFVFAHADRLARVARAAGGEIGSSDEAVLADAGSPRATDNAVVLLQPPTPGLLDRVLTLAKRFFPVDRSWVVLSMWPTPDLAWRGLERLGHPRLLLRLDRVAIEPPPGLTIVPMDTACAADAQRVLTTVHPTLAGTRLLSVLCKGSVVALRVGYLDDRPVAVAGAVEGEDLVEPDWVMTVPEARRRGVATALLGAVVDATPDRPAVLIEPVSGSSVPGRAGFLPLLRTTVWVTTPRTVPQARRGSAPT